MNRISLFGCVVLLILPLSGQQKILVEESLVVNIEVPVRVFDGGAFINDLTIKDFEVFEDGTPQKIEAVYLIKKDLVERREEKKKFAPQTERTFFLLFEISNYDPRIGKAADYFVENVLLPTDNLIAVTPMKTYRLKDRGLEIKSRDEIAEELRGIIRKDVIMGDSEYRSALKDLEDAARAIRAEADPDLKSSGPIEIDKMDMALMKYRIALTQVESTRELDQLRMLDFANYIKNRDGQNYVYLFYEREFIPVLNTSLLQLLMSRFNGDLTVTFMLSELFEYYSRDITVDIDKVKKHFADAATSIHFLYLTRPREHIEGLRLEEHSEHMFAPFVEIAKASGGFVESSANPDYLLKNAVEASENYYLLYYSPKDYIRDGRFKEIKVRVKGKGYKVVHRLGYFSN